MEAAAGSKGYWGLREGSAWIDLSQRGKLGATGEDRARLLHALTTQHVEQMKPGDGGYTFFLNAQGRILGDANLICREDHFLIDTEPETRQKLFEHIDHYIIADDVTLEDVTARMAAIAVEGPTVAEALEKLGAPVPEAKYSSLEWNDGLVVRVGVTGADGFSLMAPAARKDEWVATLVAAGIPGATAEDARVVRIENGHPRYGEEITERYLVQETGQLQAISFSKGCYLGQEIVERVRSRAQIHRVLRRLEIAGNDAPAAGTKLKAGEADAGEIASAVFSPALGKVAAMAYVRTAFAEPGTELQADGALARVV